MSDTTKDAVRKTNSLFPSAQNRFFYTDPSGDGSRFFSTETERDAAMKEAIAAWCDEGWSKEVDQIFSGVVTHTVEKCDVQTKPQPCAAHPDHDYGDNDCEACIAWDEFPNHEFDEVCNYKPVALLVPAQVQAEAVREPLYRAAINCPHSIEHTHITLHYDAKQPGHNALDQLARRLEAAAPSTGDQS